MTSARRGGKAGALAVGLLLAVTAFAGCLDMFRGDDDAEPHDGPHDPGAPPNGNETTPPHGTTPPPHNETWPPSNETWPPSNETEQPENRTTMEWSHDNRTGTVSGTALLITGRTPVQETFTVGADTAQLFVNVTVEGSAIDVELAPPGCDDADCRHTIDVSAGSGSHAQADPESGEWTVVFQTRTTLGPYSTEYGLSITQGVVVELPPEEEDYDEEKPGDGDDDEDDEEEDEDD